MTKRQDLFTVNSPASMMSNLTSNERKLDLLERSIEAGADDQARIIRDLLLRNGTDEIKNRVTELCKDLPPKPRYKQ